jgi:transcriptional regulator
MPGISAGNLYGTLELLILSLLDRDGPLHGVGVADRIARRSGEHFRIEEGSLYPALHRLQAKRLVDWEWRRTSGGKRAKYYRISKAGRRALERQRSDWLRSARAIVEVLEVSLEDMR